MTDVPSNIGQATRAIAADGDLPFEVVEVAHLGGQIRVTVRHSQVDAAKAYFDANPVVLTDGQTVPLRVSGVRAQYTPSTVPSDLEVPDGVPVGLIGLQVDAATQVASAAGWFVRAYEEGAAITADLRPNRLNLVYDGARRVTSRHVG